MSTAGGAPGRPSFRPEAHALARPSRVRSVITLVWMLRSPSTWMFSLMATNATPDFARVSRIVTTWPRERPSRESSLTTKGVAGLETRFDQLDERNRDSDGNPVTPSSMGWRGNGGGAPAAAASSWPRPGPRQRSGSCPRSWRSVRGRPPPSPSPRTGVSTRRMEAVMGDLAGEVRIVRWLLATVVAVTIIGFGVLGGAMVLVLARLS